MFENYYYRLDSGSDSGFIKFYINAKKIYQIRK